MLFRTGLPSRILTVADVERSAQFYETVFGGRIVRKGEPTYIQIANTWLIVNVGGGPTPDKLTVTLRPPTDLDEVSSFMNIRVSDIQACYQLWRSRGAQFITEPLDKYGEESRRSIRDPDGDIIEVGESKLEHGDDRNVNSGLWRQAVDLSTDGGRVRRQASSVPYLSATPATRVEEEAHDHGRQEDERETHTLSLLSTSAASTDRRQHQQHRQHKEDNPACRARRAERPGW